MFTNVLVGVDGARGGRDAIALARLLADPAAALTLAHVYPVERLPWPGSGLAFHAGSREESISMLTELRDQIGVPAELRSIGAPSVGRGLHGVAEAIGADLMVVGSTSRSLFGRVRLGDDTRAALNGAPCAVAVAPAGYEHEAVIADEIGVGYDGSAESEHALAFARRLATELGVRLSAFEAVSLPARAFAAGAPPMAERAIDELVDEAHERVSALAGVEPHASYGDPSEELASYSASLDLLVVGSRDYGPVGRLVHGSTSAQLARVTRCPLLVLTRAARAQDAALPGLDQPVLEGVPNEVGAGSQA